MVMSLKSPIQTSIHPGTHTPSGHTPVDSGTEGHRVDSEPYNTRGGERHQSDRVISDGRSILWHACHRFHLGICTPRTVQ